MNARVSAFVLIVSFTLLTLLFFTFRNEKGVPLKKTDNLHTRHLVVSPRENSFFLNNNREKIESDIDDMKVVAKTSKEAGKIASDVYNKLFPRETPISNHEMLNGIYSMFGLENGVFNAVEAREGEAIDVNSFFENEPFSQFIPLYSYNKVIAVSIFREYDKKAEKELGSVSEIKEGWSSYPPIMPYDAETRLIQSYPNLSYTTVPGYYYIEDGRTPYFLYEGNDGQSTKYYLVSAYHKHIIVKDNRDAPKPPLLKRNKEGFIVDDLIPPIRTNKDGLLEMDASVIASFPERKQAQLRSEIEWTNKYIREGKVKFDEEINIIYDKRTEEDKRRDDEMLAAQEKQQDTHDANTSDDRKIDIPSEPAHAVQ